jgi:AraC family transcriptional regulator
MNSRQAYLARINRVIDHIDANLAEPLDLETLSAVAHFSAFHFHRVFRAMTGETLGDWVRRRRLEVAASRLLSSPDLAASAIGFDVGFASPEVFTRAFRAHFKVTPGAWRRGAHREWAQEHQQRLSKIHQSLSNEHQSVVQAFRHDPDLWPSGRLEPTGGQPMNVVVKNLPEKRVAYMRSIGPYGGTEIPRLWQRFAVWCEEHGLMNPRRVMYGISQDNPEVTPPEKCRYDACIEVDASFKPTGEVGIATIAGGRYACGKFVGTPAQIHGAWNELCEWLPDSGSQVDDRLAIEVYGLDFVMDEKTGAFNCDLCMPVKAM